MAEKIFTITLAVIILIIFAVSTSQVDAKVKGITSKNYDSYVKPIADEYGYNIGECDKPYLKGEEQFYNDYYDHWNVDKVYDESLLTNKKIAKEFCKTNYKGYKVKFIKLNKKGWKKLLNRKGKKIVYVEKCVTKSCGNYGYTIKGHYYVAYNTTVPKGEKVTSYFVYNPKTNYIDDVVVAIDNLMMR